MEKIGRPSRCAERGRTQMEGGTQIEGELKRKGELKNFSPFFRLVFSPGAMSQALSAAASVSTSSSSSATAQATSSSSTSAQPSAARLRTDSSDSDDYGPAPPPAGPTKLNATNQPRGRATDRDRQKAESLGYVLSGARRARIQAERAKRAEPTNAERKVQMIDEIKKRQEKEAKVVEGMKRKSLRFLMAKKGKRG